MSRQPRRNQSPAFKARVALADVKGTRTEQQPVAAPIHCCDPALLGKLLSVAATKPTGVKGSV
jgi:hypothetical protein